jgi:type I restriction enzyme, S subunit
MGRRLEGNYHNPIARAAEMAVSSNGRTTERLGNLVDRIFIPGRFKHIYGPEGLAYLDSAQILEVAPDVEKYVLSLNDEKRAGYLVDRGTLLLPCSGQLHGVIGNVVLAGQWHEHKVLTNHILRIVPKSRPTIRIGYLQAVLSHPRLGRTRVLRGTFGSSVPELSVWDIENMTVPRLNVAQEEEIADAMEEAAILSARANTLEDQVSEEAELIVRAFLSHKA